MNGVSPITGFALAVVLFASALLVIGTGLDDALVDHYDDGTFVAQDNDIDLVDGTGIDATVTYDGNDVEYAVAIAPAYQLPQGCADGEPAEFSTSSSRFECGTDGGGGGGGAVAFQNDGIGLTNTATHDAQQGIVFRDIGSKVQADADIDGSVGGNPATLTTDRIWYGVGNLATTTALSDAIIPNDLTIDLATTATALAENGANCAAGQAPLGVDASGAVEGCFTPAGGGGGGVNVQEDGTPLTATSTIDFDQGVLAIDVTGSVARVRIVLTEASLTSDATIIGNSSGIATAVTWPDCDTAGGYIRFDQTTDAITCDTVGDDDVPDSITIDLAATATALAANPADCAAGTKADSIVANGDLTCTAVDSADIQDDTVAPVDLDAVDTENDEECVTYESTGAAFEFQSCVAGADGRSLTESAGVLAADNELYEDGCTVFINNYATDTTDADELFAGCFTDNAVSLTIERFECVTSVGNASVTLDEYARTSVFGSGTRVDPVFDCGTSGTTGGAETAFDNAGIAAGSGIRIRLGTRTNDADIAIFIDVDKDD